jgi:hypothetical protein
MPSGYDPNLKEDLDYPDVSREVDVLVTTE